MTKSLPPRAHCFNFSKYYKLSLTFCRLIIPPAVLLQNLLNNLYLDRLLLDI